MASNRVNKPKRLRGGRPRPGVVALSSAAVLAVYSAGFVRTSSAAHRFDVQDAARARAVPMVALAASPAATPVSPLPLSAAAAPAALPAPTAAPTLTTTPIPVAAAAPTPATPTEAASSALVIPDVAPVLSAPPVTAPVIKIGPTAPEAAPAPAPAAAPATAAAAYKDGTYSGWGSSRHGDIQAQIVIAQGKITSARIQQCLTRYSCSWIAELPGQVVRRQSANVDYVSGATQSSDAFYYAIAQALQAALGH